MSSARIIESDSKLFVESRSEFCSTDKSSIASSVNRRPLRAINAINKNFREEQICICIARNRDRTWEQAAEAFNLALMRIYKQAKRGDFKEDLSSKELFGKFSYQVHLEAIGIWRRENTRKTFAHMDRQSSDQLVAGQGSFELDEFLNEFHDFVRKKHSTIGSVLVELSWYLVENPDDGDQPHKVAAQLGLEQQTVRRHRKTLRKAYRAFAEKKCNVQKR